MTSWGPLDSVLISLKIARTRSLIRKVSLPTNSPRGSNPSALLPKSTMTLSRVTFLTIPAKSSPIRSRYKSTICARSASRTRCTMTCLAVCAAMRPKSAFSIISSCTSPICKFASASAASSVVNCVPSNANSVSGTTSQRLRVWYSPLTRSITTSISASSS